MRTIVTLFASLALTHAGELHQAARVCDTDRMRQLLSQDAAVNETDQNGMTPLHIAIDSRQTACVRLLLEAGADRRARDAQGRTAVDAAREITNVQDRANTLMYLSWNSGEKMPESATGPMPWSLEYSTMRRQTDVTKMLLAMGADPNAIGTGGTTPLADAALKGDLDGVRTLLAHGARPNAINKTGTQPIHDAALGDNAEVIRELVKQGADVNARTRDEAQTPLHIAASMGKMKAVDALVALGADLTMKDSNGRTPRDAAERAGLTDGVAFLKLPRRPNEVTSVSGDDLMRERCFRAAVSSISATWKVQPGSASVSIPIMLFFCVWMSASVTKTFSSGSVSTMYSAIRAV